MDYKRIIVFTGGGLAPALNATLAGVIDAARESGITVLGGLRGWASLLDNGKIVDISSVDTELIQKIGGTFLRSSRTNIFKVENGIEQVKLKIKEHQIDVIFAIGGNDTLGEACELFKKEGIPVIGIPKTIDNDLSETYWTPGYPSAAIQMAQIVKEIREDAAYTLSRIFVIEALGMHAGWLALAGACGGADVIIPPEKQVSLSEVVRLTGERYEENGNFACVVVSQEARFDEPLNARDDDQTDHFGTVRREYVCLALRDRLKKDLGVYAKAIYPGNFLESGHPIDIDRVIAYKLGLKSIELLKEEKFGFMPSVVRNGAVVEVGECKLENVIGEGNYRFVPDNFFDWKQMRATDEFMDYMKPVLGAYPWMKDDAYYQLIKTINS